MSRFDHVYRETAEPAERDEDYFYEDMVERERSDVGPDGGFPSSPAAVRPSAEGLYLLAGLAVIAVLLAFLALLWAGVIWLILEIL